MSFNTLLHLSLIEHVGPAGIKHLIDCLGTSIDTVYSMSASDFIQLGCSFKKAEILVTGLQNKFLLHRELELLEKNPIKVVTFFDKEYPAILKEIALPPYVLYYQGTLEKIDQSIAIVGSRKCSQYGIKTVKSLVPDLVAAGFTIISGGALGIDAHAHTQTLVHGGTTIAVVGSGLLKPYPLSNVPLYDQIVDSGGALISCFPLTFEALPGNFPARNRIISGMSLGTVVVQAAYKSGALITARYSLEQNREVFVVPGMIDDPLSAGCHELIKQGARLITSSKDIFDEFSLSVKSMVVPAELQPQEQLATLDPILQLCMQPKSLDELVQELSISINELQIKLFDLQIQGKIEQDFAGMWKCL